jgi:fatty acid desaturase
VNDQAQHPSLDYMPAVAWPTVAMCFSVLGLYLLSWTAVLSGAIALWQGALLNAVLAYASFTPYHEATHGNISARRPGLGWLNEMCGWLAGIPLGECHALFRVAHLKHHAHTNNPERDPDYFEPGVSGIRLFWRTLTLVSGYLRAFLSDDTVDAGVIRNRKLLGTVWYGGVLVVAVTASLAGYLAEVLMLGLLPASLAWMFLGMTFDWVPHRPHIERKRYLTTRVTLFPGLKYALLWQNFHLVHHLYPTIPFYLYDRCFERVRGELAEHGALVTGRG